MGSAGKVVTAGSGGSEPAATLTIGGGDVTEGTDTYAVWTLGLSGALQDDVVISLSLGGTATEGSDYSTLEVSTDGVSYAPGSALTFLAGETVRYARVTLIDDSDVEPVETIILQASVTSGNVSNSTASGTVQLTSEDVAAPVGTKYAYFDGTAYADFPEWLDSDGDYTIRAKFLPQNAASTRVIVGSSADTGSYIATFAVPDIRAKLGGATFGFNDTYLGQIREVEVVKTGSTAVVTLYDENGTQLGQDSGTPGTTVSLNTIGRNSLGYYFIGYILELEISDAGDTRVFDLTTDGAISDGAGGTVTATNVTWSELP